MLLNSWAKHGQKNEFEFNLLALLLYRTSSLSLFISGTKLKLSNNKFKHVF